MELNKDNTNFILIKKPVNKRIKITAEGLIVILQYDSINDIRMVDKERLSDLAPNKNILNKFLKFIGSRYKDVKIIKNEKVLIVSKKKTRVLLKIYTRQYYFILYFRL